jgi:hypothetical protein
VVSERGHHIGVAINLAGEILVVALENNVWINRRRSFYLSIPIAEEQKLSLLEN